MSTESDYKVFYPSAEYDYQTFHDWGYPEMHARRLKDLAGSWFIKGHENSDQYWERVTEAILFRPTFMRYCLDESSS